jgi:hypothetical protein
MNISYIAKKALIPIEREIKTQPVEHFYQLNNKGEILSHFKGDIDRVEIKYVEDNLISTHNHPNSNNFLSTIDIINAIRLNNREMRVITKDGYCHLAEIPKIAPLKRMDCIITLIRYRNLYNEEGYSWKLIRKMKKEIEKTFGLKFRTVLLPKS